MPDFTTRSADREMMDDLSCEGDVVGKTLRELEFINKWLGGNAVTISALNTLSELDRRDAPLRIADLGCGSGDMLRIISAWADRKGIAVDLTGIDANANIIAYAAENLRNLPSVRLLPLDILSSEFNAKNYDVVIGTLFFHHFTQAELIAFFTRLRENGTRYVIINDIHRHYLAYHSIRILTRLFSASPMVKHDAPLSVLRAFSRGELEQALLRSGFRIHQIRWKWAFRWQVIAGIR